MDDVGHLCHHLSTGCQIRCSFNKTTGSVECIRDNITNLLEASTDLTKESIVLDSIICFSPYLIESEYIQETVNGNLYICNRLTCIKIIPIFALSIKIRQCAF